MHDRTHRPMTSVPSSEAAMLASEKAPAYCRLSLPLAISATRAVDEEKSTMAPLVAVLIWWREREGRMGEATSWASAQGGAREANAPPASLRVNASHVVISTGETNPLATHTTCLRVDAQLEQQRSRHHAATQTKKPACVYR